MKKDINSLEQASMENEFQSEAQKAFEDNAQESKNETKRRKRKSFKEIREELKRQDAELSENKEQVNAAEEEAQEMHKSFIDEAQELEKKHKVGKTRLAVASFILLLGVGILGNWYFENTDVSKSVKPLISATESKTLGEAELVGATAQSESADNESEYFSQARLDRQSARDETLEKLQAVIDSADESNEAKQTAAESITRISNYISIENKIETLVSAKGVNNCLAVVSEDGMKVDIIVDCDELTDTVILQIKEIAIQQLGCSFESVSIIEAN